MVVGISVTSTKLLKNLTELQRKAASGVQMRGALTNLAERIIQEARIRAPLRFGELKNSDFVAEPSKGANGRLQIKLGFNAEHAIVMDQGWTVSVIRPVRAKALFIPLSRRAARLGAVGGGRVSEMLKGRGAALVPGVDFVFAKSVKTKAPVKGRRSGPNFYFSGTVEDFIKERSPSLALVLLARGVVELLHSVDTGITKGARAVARFEGKL